MSEKDKSAESEILDSIDSLGLKEYVPRRASLGTAGKGSEVYGNLELRYEDAHPGMTKYEIVFDDKGNFEFHYRNRNSGIKILRTLEALSRNLSIETAEEQFYDTKMSKKEELRPILDSEGKLPER